MFIHAPLREKLQKVNCIEYKFESRRDVNYYSAYIQ